MSPTNKPLTFTKASWRAFCASACIDDCLLVPKLPELPDSSEVGSVEVDAGICNIRLGLLPVLSLGVGVAAGGVAGGMFRGCRPPTPGRRRGGVGFIFVATSEFRQYRAARNESRGSRSGCLVRATRQHWIRDDRGEDCRVVYILIVLNGSAVCGTRSSPALAFRATRA